MADLTRTTVYLNTADYRRLRNLARATGKSTAELVREAVSAYARQQGSPEPRSIGAGRSGRGDLSERAEELLAGMRRK